MGDVLITGVTLPSGVVTDLGIQGSHLVEPDTLVRPRRIAAAGLIALPGLVDLHTHLREPSPQPAETMASGTAAAARGGFTAVFAMANTDPVTDTAAAVEDVRRLAQGTSAEVVPVGAITAGLGGRVLADIKGMATAGVRYFCDDGRCVMDAAVMRAALLAVGGGGLVGQHCQDHDLAAADGTVWPAVAESVIVARDVQLARDTGTPLHLCHISTAESVEIIRWAKARHVPVSAEVTPHHLLLDTALTTTGDTAYKVNPPLRGEADRAALRQGLAEGTIDIVATDHAPHLATDKARPYAEAKPGMIGLEYALGVVMACLVEPGLMTWEGVAETLSYRPARLGRIAGHQGRPLRPGEPATLTLVDPARRRVIDKDASLSLGRNNPYHGLDLPDPVVGTFWAGRPTYLSPALG